MISMFYVYLSQITPPAHTKNYVCRSVEVCVIAGEFSLVYIIINRVTGGLAQIKDKSARAVGFRGSSKWGNVTVRKGRSVKRASCVTPF